MPYANFVDDELKGLWYGCFKVKVSHTRQFYYGVASQIYNNSIIVTIYCCEFFTYKNNDQNSLQKNYSSSEPLTTVRGE